MATGGIPAAARTSTERAAHPDFGRQLNGTSFLTLEHTGYFALVVLVPFLLLTGAMVAMGLWSDTSGANALMAISVWQPAISMVGAPAAFMISAALVVLATLLYALRRRTAAEYAKRPGYTARVGYKLPIYTALGLLVALSIGTVVCMLSAVLGSLALIGVSGADIAQPYMRGLLPALLGFIVFGVAGWYVMWFAKGKDTSRAFVGVMCLLSLIVAVSLFIAAADASHHTHSMTPLSTPSYPFQDGLNYFRY